MSKLPVLTQQPEFGLDEFRYLNYVHSLLCLYPVADVWRDYKATRSKFIDRCIRELMPSLTEGVDINAVASNFNQLCDILLSVVNEDFLVFSTGVFKDVLTTFDAVSDTYLEKVSDELIGIIEYIHDATIQMDSTKLDIHKSKSDQGILSTLRGCRANSNSVKSLDALLSRSQEQLIDSPFSISFLHTLVKLVAACSRVEQHLRGLHNMGTWTPGLQSIRNLKSVLKVASDVPLQTQSSIDAFMGHQVTTFDSSAPSGSTENAIRSIHGPLFTWEWRLIFKKLVCARRVHI
ncbi:PREDICTED: uncharacterized protein LOC106817858 [Priapulus caudatus]|uniref:Uncharacterized protein LOC106817858 n=1 Tax=Priapulus caudatus TaxID=37621 RepID=A0ABM1F0T5_PRICU|nr:PREDICTED: uncharacterized protein LOC106817858 [Priapulus caudatus]